MLASFLHKEPFDVQIMTPKNSKYNNIYHIIIYITGGNHVSFEDIIEIGTLSTSFIVLVF